MHALRLRSCALLACLLANFRALAAEETAAEASAPPQPPSSAKPPAPEPPPPATPRSPTATVNLTLVPWGVAYTRSGAGLGATYKAPLVKREGFLWDTTNVTVGVRDFYGFVNNSLAAWVEVTPIAFFKLQVFGSYDSLIVDPFSGGVRALTDLGAQRLAEGRVLRGDPDAVDWSDDPGAKDNERIFKKPRSGDGLRLKILPTLQGKVGPIAIQYNFTVDFNFYRAGDYGSGAIFHDNFTFTLRKMHDVGFVHEGVVAWAAEGPDELLLGVTAKYYQISGTDLDTLFTGALVFFRPRWRFAGERLSLWGAAQAGTNPIDPMYENAFAWVLATGVDLKVF
jgi:hypothetical protein